MDVRLIDADALRAQFAEPDDWMDPNKALVHITGIWAEIDNAPTIEPERKKGHWIRLEGDSRFMCSVCICKEKVPTIMGDPVVWKWCPNCGARIGGVND